MLLDLVLLKLGVYRHLLYNHGAPPRRLAGATSAPMGASGGASTAADDDEDAGANTKKKGEGDGGAGAGAVDEDAHAAAVKETVRYSPFGRLNSFNIHPSIQARWALLVQLGATLVLIDACKSSLPSRIPSAHSLMRTVIRYTYLRASPSPTTSGGTA